MSGHKQTLEFGGAAYIDNLITIQFVYCANYIRISGLAVHELL